MLTGRTHPHRSPAAPRRRGVPRRPRGYDCGVTATDDALRNWSGSHRYRATSVHRPRSTDELRSLVTSVAGTLQVLATRHTFTAIGDADGLVVLDALPGATAIEIDEGARQVTIGPSVTYAMLASALNERGLALENLASLPHISVAGAVATATHGSGSALRNLAAAVASLQLLTSGGDTVELGRDDPRFPGAVVHLGALGVITRLTLDVVPYYELRQDVYLRLGWDALDAHYEEIMGAGRSVSVFHDFGTHAREVWVKRDAGESVEDELFGARAAHEAHNPAPGGPPESCTAQLGFPGPWSERLPHFRTGFTPSAGEEIQSEWFVARADGPAAIRALRPLAERITPVLRIAELRTIAADELWMSPQYERDSAGLHFTWRLEPDAVRTVCAEIEQALVPLGPRPHWGKVHVRPAAPPTRLADFLALRAELDPRGTFANDWLRAEVMREPA